MGDFFRKKEVAGAISLLSSPAYKQWHIQELAKLEHSWSNLLKAHRATAFSWEQATPSQALASGLLSQQTHANLVNTSSYPCMLLQIHSLQLGMPRSLWLKVPSHSGPVQTLLTPTHPTHCSPKILPLLISSRLEPIQIHVCKQPWQRPAPLQSDSLPRERGK